MIDDHYVTREEFEALVAAARPKKGGFIQFVCGTLMIALAVIGGYFLLVIYFDAPASSPAAPPTTKAITTQGGGPSTGGSSYSSAPRPPSLPDCATVTDSRTACTGAVGEMPQGAAEEPQTEQPTGTPEPRWVTETCLTPPGERPCWLPPDQPWQPPASVPETPVVLVAATSVPLVFADSACAAWRPPLAWPEGCPTGGDE